MYKKALRKKSFRQSTSTISIPLFILIRLFNQHFILNKLGEKIMFSIILNKFREKSAVTINLLIVNR